MSNQHGGEDSYTNGQDATHSRLAGAASQLLSRDDLAPALRELVAAAERIAMVADQIEQDNLPDAPGVAQLMQAPLAVAGLDLSPVQLAICRRVLNVFETGSVDGDYSAISIFADGPNNIRQITYGRAQTMEYGNLRKLVEMYVGAGGQFASQLRPFVPQIGTIALVDNAGFKTLLRKAGSNDPVMRSTQDIFFDRLYLEPALAWAGQNGFTRALSALVIYDSFIHSGRILDLLRARFDERPPAHGGNEQVWIRQYVEARHQWLLGHDRPAVRASAYRTRDLAREIARGNWDLSLLPIIANGTPVDAGPQGLAGGFVSENTLAMAGAGTPANEADSVDHEIWGDDAYATQTLAAPAALTADGDVATLASRILNDQKVKLATGHVSGEIDQAAARQNIIDVAAGMKATRSHYGTAPGGKVALDPRLLRGIVSLAQQYSFSISELAGGSHNANSRHYAGLAVDFNILNGRGIRAGHPDLAAFMARCRALGATELLGPGPRITKPMFMPRGRGCSDGATIVRRQADNPFERASNAIRFLTSASKSRSGTMFGPSDGA
jgi:chitosanase